MARTGVYVIATMLAIVTLAMAQSSPSRVQRENEVSQDQGNLCDHLTGRWTSTNPSTTLCLEVYPETGEMLTLLRNGTNLFFTFGLGMTVHDDNRHIGFTTMEPPTTGSLGDVVGFTGECHKCEGNEVIIMSSSYRNKARSPECGISDGVRTVDQYVLTRTGPGCRGMVLDVHNPNSRLLAKMGVRARSTVSDS